MKTTTVNVTNEKAHEIWDNGYAIRSRVYNGNSVTLTLSQTVYNKLLKNKIL